MNDLPLCNNEGGRGIGDLPKDLVLGAVGLKVNVESSGEDSDPTELSSSVVPIEAVSCRVLLNRSASENVTPSLSPYKLSIEFCCLLRPKLPAPKVNLGRAVFRGATVDGMTTRGSLFGPSWYAVTR